MMYLTITKDIQDRPTVNPNKKSWINPIIRIEDQDINSGLLTIQNIVVIIPNNGAINAISYGINGKTNNIVKIIDNKSGTNKTKLDKKIRIIFIIYIINLISIINFNINTSGQSSPIYNL